MNIEMELEREMEEIKKVRRATRDDGAEEGLLEMDKRRFSFASLPNKIIFTEFSVSVESETTEKKASKLEEMILNEWNSS